MSKCNTRFSVFCLICLMFIPVPAVAARAESGLSGSAVAGSDAPCETKIIVASDIHYIAPELTDNGTYFRRIVDAGDGKAMYYIEEITDAFLAQVISQMPDLLILSGDLTFNGAKQSHISLSDKLDVVQKAGIQVLVIPGNHDLNCSMAASFSGDTYALVESVDAEAFAEIYGEFGYDQALARDPSSLSYVYEAAPDLRILLIDVNTAEAAGRLKEETFAWAGEQLKDAEEAGANVIGVSHQNLLPHNSLFIDGFVMVGYEQLAELYEKYEVLFNLSGHMHVQHIAENEREDGGRGIADIASEALAVYPCQYGVLHVSSGAAGSGGEEHQEQAEYETQEVAFAHAEEARQMMYDTSVRSLQKEFPDASEELCAFFSEVNMGYFSGRLKDVAWDEDLYEEIRQKAAITGVYLMTLRDELATDQRRWTGVRPHYENMN